MIYLELFWTFFKIGAFTFGGGYAMLPMVQQEVSRHGWMTMQELVDFIAVSESTPGPFAVNVSTYVGTRTAGLGGAFAATGGVILPSFVIILLVAKAYERFKESRAVAGAMSGLRPAVVGLIGASVINIGQEVFFPDGLSLQAVSGTVSGSAFWVSAAIFALALFLMLKKKINPIKIIVISLVCGLAAGYAGLLN
ncbi:MAG: chromate transporter [Lachnospiraceae bacterium]|jgi:chromate transporter